MEGKKQFSTIEHQLSFKNNLSLNNDGNKLTYIYDTKSKRTGITSLLNEIRNEGFTLKDITTEKSSLESIFINLVKGSNNELSSS